MMGTLAVIGLNKLLTAGTQAMDFAVYYTITEIPNQSKRCFKYDVKKNTLVTAVS